MKDKVMAKATEIKMVAKGLFEFLDATALATVSGWAIYTGLQHRGQFWFSLLFAAGAIIAIQAAHLYWKHFSK